MARCTYCGEQSSQPYTCNYCGSKHCSDHRLPENHDCVGLYPRDSKRFESDAPSTLHDSNDSSTANAADPRSYARRTRASRETDSGKRRGGADTWGATDDDAEDSAKKCPSCGNHHRDEYECSHCGGVFCRDCRAPWDHGCPENEPATDFANSNGETDAANSVSSNVGTGQSGPFIIALSYAMLPIMLLYVLVRGTVRAVIGNPLASLFVVAIVSAGGAMAIAGPVDLGHHFGPAGEDLDEDITGVVDGVSVALPTNEKGGGVLASDPNATATPTQSRYERLLEAPRSRLVQLVHAEINARREEHGLDPLNYDPELGEIAQDYSEAMLERDTLSHTGADGDSFEDRYQEHGYLCSVEINENWNSGGAENILYTYYETEIEGGLYYDTPQELADAIATQWMNSKGHRENILEPYWHNEGLGIAAGWVDGHIKVYVTQNFC